MQTVESRRCSSLRFTTYDVTARCSPSEQVRSIDVRRLTERLGVLPGMLLRDLDDGLRVHLDL